MNNSRITVALFVPFSRIFAGIEFVSHGLADTIAKRFSDIFDIHVIYGNNYNIDVLNNTAYTSHYICVPKLRDIPLRLRPFFQREEIDILICPQIEASTMLWLAALGTRVPVFITHLHGNISIERQTSFRSRLMFFFFRHVVSRFITGLFAVSPSLKDFIPTQNISRPETWFVKNPLRLFTDELAQLPSGSEYRFVCVARLAVQKGQMILLQAFSRVARERPQVRLSLVGSGPAEEELRQTCHSLGIAEKVDFHGYVADPTGHYKNAHCFVLASRGEGFSLVLIEALGFGLPVVSTNCQFGPSDIITDPRLGFLTPVDDAEAFAEAMIKTMDRPLSEEHRLFRRALAASYRPTQAADMFVHTLQKVIGKSLSPGKQRRFATFLQRKIY